MRPVCMKKPGGHGVAPRPAAVSLFLLGFLTLFLELGLIRYLSGNVWNLGYFPNLVLIAVFVGMGGGFLLHQFVPDRRSGMLFALAGYALFLLLGFVYLARPNVPGFGRWGGHVGDELFFTNTPVEASSDNPLLFAIWFGAVVIVFALISQRTAKVFRRFAPLSAYSLDIGGSCCGIVAFMGMSVMQAPAWSWFGLAIPLFVAGAPRAREAVGRVPHAVGRGRLIGLIALIAPLLGAVLIARQQDANLLSNAGFDGPLEVRWSPYQKVEYAESSAEQAIFVNGIWHQAIKDADGIRADFYPRPYDERTKQPDLPPYRRVLVIGAGSGNDVACALLHGAEHVDAVEIDPVLAELGRWHHPLRPYDDPRVRVTIDDGRAFLTRATERYDLIVFALTDSLVKVSPIGQLRLENYLFTEQSLRQAFGLLNEHGSLVLYNAYRDQWLIDKIRRTVSAATGRATRILWQERAFAVLSVSRSPEASGLAGRGPIGVVNTTVDDWPFLYLRERGIPRLYRNAMVILSAAVALMLLVQGRIGRRAAAARPGGPGLAIKLAFLLMGVAFLLLETKGVIQFSLLFGTTWVNTSLVFLAVLLLVLAANWTAHLVAGRSWTGAVGVLLILSCLAALAYPLAGLLHEENRVWRFVLAALLTFAPIFFANLIFSLAFREQKVAEHLFGWNLIGATLGGVLEYCSMAIGYNALAAVVAALYVFVLFLLGFGGRRRLRHPAMGA